MTAKQRGAEPDGGLRGRANATKDELHELGQALREHGVSERTRLLLAKLASYPPNVRLVVNLKATVGLMVGGPVYGVLRDGLTTPERDALVELDMRGLSTSAREIAHGLLNIHERWVTLQALRNLFRRAIDAKEEFLVPKDLQEEAP